MAFILPSHFTFTYHRYQARARQVIHTRVKELNQSYGFMYRRISVKDTKTRWGSCSSKGNLNFHYRLFFLPEHLRDYVIVHELCHLQELNHSRRFWKLVARTIPEYGVYRAELRQYSIIYANRH